MSLPQRPLKSLQTPPVFNQSNHNIEKQFMIIYKIINLSP